MNEFYEKLYGLSYIIRYAGVPKIKDESVAEHSFFVASFVIKLHEYYYFNLGVALQMAITHDWGEAFVGDVSYTLKSSNKQLCDAVDKAEDSAMFRNFSEEVYEVWLKFNNQDCVEAKIVLLADILQVVQYTEHEVKLGNTSMSAIVNSAETRLHNMLEALNGYKREK